MKLLKLLRHQWWAIFLLVFISHCGAIYASEQQDLPIEIYVNQSVPDKSYSLSDVRAIFAMRKKRWSDGEKIQVFVLPDDDLIHRKFAKSRLKMFPHQLRRIWDRLIFSGIGLAPTEVPSLEEMENKIAVTPGAIGYLHNHTNNKKLRVMTYE